jgi:hypothetical protein
MNLIRASALLFLAHVATGADGDAVRSRTLALSDITIDGLPIETREPGGSK